MNKSLMALGLALGATIANADVYKDVYFWSRGLATDTNGDGILQPAELRDSMNGPLFSGVLGAGQIQFASEWGRLPYRGVRRMMQFLYLPQKVESGTIWPDSITIPNARIKDVIGAGSPHYALMMRFKPEVDQRDPYYCWIFNFGRDKASDRGLMIGWDPRDKMTTTIKSGDVSVDDVTVPLYVFAGAKTFYPGVPGTSAADIKACKCRISLGHWNDLVVSVNGQKISILLSRDGYLVEEISALNSNAKAGYNTSYYETDLPSSTDATPMSGADLIIGAETVATASSSYTAGKSQGPNKHFRGAIQDIAIWTNSLSEAEMRLAAGYPRPDLWRVGVDDSSAVEFDSAASGASVDADADKWAVPVLDAGVSFSVKFPLNMTGEAEMDNYVRIKTVPGSAPVRLKIAVNGHDLPEGEKWCAGGYANWYVTSDCLLSGATNVVTIARTDSAIGSAWIDTVAFGGSLQYGEHDGSNLEFTSEGSMQNEADSIFDLAGGNWFDGSRALFCTGTNTSGKITSCTNQLIRFSIPAELLGTCDYKLKWCFSNCGNSRFVLNGQVISAADNVFSDSVEHEVVIKHDLLQSENLLNVINIRPRTTNDSYISPDYIRLDAQRPRGGLVLIIR